MNYGRIAGSGENLRLLTHRTKDLCLGGLESMNHTWRLLRTGQHNAAMNMAIDEAILVRQAKNLRPTLRFYDWSQAALSFGYFQRVADEVDVPACISRGIELVRRMTGGGTVVHGWDVTYSVVVPHNDVLPKSISASYSAISGCLISGFKKIGVPNPQIEALTQHTIQNRRSGKDLANICLTNPAKYDVMLDGKKIAGVSQRRNQIGVMYQGYIALDMPPPEVLAHASRQPDSDQHLKGQSAFINAGEGASIDRRQIEDSVAAGLAEQLGVHLIEGNLTTQEAESADCLAQTKYATDEWNFRR